MAVLDSKLRVRGVQGLRVADTSIMPLLNQGHTQMPAYAIGEKAADLIKGNWMVRNWSWTRTMLSIDLRAAEMRIDLEQVLYGLVEMFYEVSYRQLHPQAIHLPL
jgi:hypothetical protein